MKCRFLTSVLAIPLCLSLTALSNGQQALGTFKVKILYDGETIPERKKVQNIADEFCAKLDIQEESLVVNAENKGIANMVLFVDGKKSNLKPEDIKPELDKVAAEPIVLDNKNCVFVPHVLRIRPGDTIRVKNSDQTGHNANFTFMTNKAQNFLIPAGGFKDMQVPKSEKFPMPVECNVHTWMKAYVLVLDNPFNGSTDENGELVIADMPAGKELSFKLWHERMNKSFSEGKMNGEAVEFKKGVFEMTLEEGENTLEIHLGADQFKE